MLQVTMVEVLPTGVAAVQAPREVVAPRNSKFAGSVSRMTVPAESEGPRFRATMVYVHLVAGRNLAPVGGLGHVEGRLGLDGRVQHGRVVVRVRVAGAVAVDRHVVDDEALALVADAVEGVAAELRCSMFGGMVPSRLVTLIVAVCQIGRSARC